MSTILKYTSAILISILCIGVLTTTPLSTVFAQPTPTINYQGKLTTPTGIAVSNGTYAMEFKLYTQASGGTAIWTETRTGGNEVTVESGLFSVMLGSVTPLTSVNFNQPLYLGVNIESDGEMTPRKAIGSVPSAFEAKQLGGVASSSFLRSDAADSASGLLTFTGGLISTASSSIARATFTTATTTNLVINGERFTDLTGTGLINNSGVLSIATSTLGLLASGDINTSAELAAILTDETGTAGSVVFSASPTLTGTLTAAAADFSGQVDFAGNTYINTNGAIRVISGNVSQPAYSFENDTNTGWYNPGDGAIRFSSNATDVFSIISGGNVGIGTTTPSQRFTVGATTGSQFLVSSTGVISDGTWQGDSIADAYLSDTITIGAGSTFANNIITPNNVFTSGQTDEYCLTYEATGTTWEWQTCGAAGLASTDIDTSAELAGILGDETGTGALVFGTNPTFTGTQVTFTSLTAARGLFLDASSRATTTATSAYLVSSITDETGTGALVFATSPTLTTPNLGTPSSLTLTNATGLPISGLTGLGTNVGTWLATPSSANLRAAITDETGNGGAVVFASEPTFTDTGGVGGGTITLGASGMTIATDGDGAITFFGLGNGTDENLTLNLDDTADTGVFSSASGLNLLTLSGIGISATTGTFSSTVTLSGTAANIALGSNYLSGDGGDEGIFVSSAGLVSVGDSTPDALFDIDTSLTSGTVFGVAAPGSVVLSGALTGYDMNLRTNFTLANQSVTGIRIQTANTINTGASTYNQNLADLGTSGASFTQNTGAGTSAWRGVNINTPNITQTTGTVSASGVVVTTGTVTTGGTQNGLNIIGQGVSAGTLNALNIPSITGGSGAENVISVGTGYDRILDTNTLDIMGSGSILGVQAIEIQGDVTLSGTGANILLGSNYLSGDGADEGISVDASGNVTVSGTLVATGGLTINATSETNIEAAIDTLTNLTSASSLATVGTITSGTWSGAFGNNIITPNSILTSGQTDEYCLTYEATGTTWEWQTCSGGSGANTALSNLASVAINTSLLPGSNDTIDLGSDTLRFRDLYLGGETLHIGTSLTDEGTVSYTTSTNLLNFSTDSTSNGDIAFFSDDLYLDKSTANVGIGTSTPTSRLSVAGGTSGSNTGLFTISNFGGSAANSGASVQFAGINGSGILKEMGRIGTLLQSGTNGAESSDLAFSTINGGTLAERMRLTAGGNFGIGTTTPLGKFVVRDGTNRNFLVTTDASQQGTTGIAIGAFNDAASSYMPLSIVSSKTVFNSSVGIGTTDPSTILDVRSSGTPIISLRDTDNVHTDDAYQAYISGKDSSGNEVWFMGDGSSGKQLNIIASQANYILNLGTGGTADLTIDTSGNVGLGTVSPANVLDLGNATAGRGIAWGETTSNYNNIFSSYSSAGLVLASGFKGSLVADSYLSSYGSSMARAGIRINPFGGDAGAIQFFSDTAATIANGSAYTPSERMRVTAAGDVGIGTAGPEARLQVSPAAAYSAINTGQAFVIRNTGLTGANLAMGVSGSNGNVIQSRDGNTTGYALLINPHGGNVGIGGSGMFTPAAPLNVIGNALFGGTSAGVQGSTQIVSAPGSPVSSRLTYGTDGTGWQFRIAKNQSGTVTDQLTIQDNGNVGIGDTAPDQRLSVLDTLSITNSGGTQYFLMGNQDSAGANNPSSIRAANGALYFGNGTSWTGTGGTHTDAMAIIDSGNVGIGDVTPSALLTVGNGDLFRVDSSGNVAFAAANPSITASSYTTFSGGIYISGGTGYFTNEIQTRGGINDDTNSTLTIRGGTSDRTAFTGRVITSRYGVVGTYNSSEVQGIWSIGDGYEISTGSNNFGTQYGMGYAYSTTGGAPFTGNHQIVFTSNGSVGAAISLVGQAYFGNDVGIGRTDPQKRLDVYETVADAQFRVSYDASNYADFRTTSGGDLTIDASGGDVNLLDENLFVCSGGSCASTPNGAGTITAERSIVSEEGSLGTSGSITVNWDSGNQQRVNSSTGNMTFDFSNATAGQTLRLVVCYGGAHTITWTPTIRWAGGTAPTPTSTNTKCDVFSFIYTGTEYLGQPSLNF